MKPKNMEHDLYSSRCDHCDELTKELHKLQEKERLKSFESVVVHNNWNHLTYTAGDFKFDEKTGGTCSVQWPDDSISHNVSFHSSRQLVDTHDMGHVYKTDQYSLFINVDHHGVGLKVPLNKLKVAYILQKKK